ncbi:MAG TPA: hypothetical protein PLE12_10145 [Propionicimonas sp.]|nr:hypothetical protein [Propionicimonas sp.]
MKTRVILAALLLAVSATAVASASSLGVAAPSLTTVESGHPCPGTAVATAPAAGSTLNTAVGVTLPAGCSGTRAVQLTLLSGTAALATAGGGVTGSGSVPLAGSPTSYPAARTLTTQATVDGWPLPVTWSWAPAITCRVTSVSGVPCTASVTTFVGTKPNGSAAATYYDVVVTTTSTTAVRWEVTLNLQHPSFGAVPTALGNSTLDIYSDGQTTWDVASWWGYANDVSVSGGCAAYPGTLVLVGDPVGPSGNLFSTVSASRVRRFSMVLNQNGNPAYSDVYPGGC